MVVPLALGPSIVHGENVPESQWELGNRSNDQTDGTGCPTGTQQIIRVAWNGGITKPGGNEVNNLELQQYKVTFTKNEQKIEVTPDALGDLNDGDNNHKLCFAENYGEFVSIYFPAGFVTDPNDDQTNEEQLYIKQY